MKRILQSHWLPVLAAAVVSAVLLAATLFIIQGVRDASALAARGLGDAFAVSGWQTLGGRNFPPSQEVLDSFLEAHAEDGLRYVGVFEGDGTLVASAGKALGGSEIEGLTLDQGRARLVHRLRPPRPRRGEVTPWPPPSGKVRERGPRRVPRVVYEFEPVAANALRNRASGLLVVSLIACAGILSLAVAFSRSLRQREGLREELEHGRVLASLGSMSAVLAHELRNPLASLKGHAQLLAESVEGDERASAKVGVVVSEAVRLERLLNDLLSFVKTGELRRVPADPNEVLRGAIGGTEASAVEARFLPEASRVSLDPERVQQALQNVLQNAVQVSPSGVPVQASVAREGREVVYRIRDAGPGIPPGEEERIFEPFVTGRVRGVGLGLAITRRIVELHGGKVTARNLSGGGAEFELRLPEQEP